MSGGENAKAIRDIIRRKAETLRAVLGGRAGGVSGGSAENVLATGVRAGPESVPGVSPVESYGPVGGENERVLSTASGAEPGLEDDVKLAGLEDLPVAAVE